MTRDQVVGMFVGVFIGDMLGAPYEGTDPVGFENSDQITLTTGGAHKVSLGEYTDDGALTLALAESYIANGGLNFSDIVTRFKDWRKTGKYGTRNYCFVTGKTTDNAIERMAYDRPFAATAGTYDSGNGSLMRIAACIAANHNYPMNALADTIAVSLMTHGNRDIIDYTTSFVSHVMGDGAKRVRWINLAYRDMEHKGTIMYAYSAALTARHYSHSFENALKLAISLGHDTDTNAAITGMLMGARCGVESFPQEYIDALQNKQHIFNVANALYELGDV
jgi:ADP-ribosyl-[dinitrogen reductase] hydrolase